MAKSKLVKVNQKIAEEVTDGFQHMCDSVTGGFKKMSDGVVGQYTKIEDKFVDQYLTRDGESIAEAKKRLSQENKEREMNQKH